nr:Gag-Pol polyprotein [Tanacetum cinerariifolium]
MGKAKRCSFKIIAITRSKTGLDLLHMDLCGLMRVESINGKKYILVIVDDYSRYTWTHFLRSKDETQRSAQRLSQDDSTESSSPGLGPQLQKTSNHNRSEIKSHDHNNEPSSSKLVLFVSPPADKTDSSQQELDLLFSHLFEEYFTAGNQSVSKSFALSDNSKQ